jgi:hypothetical protein
MKLQLHLAPYNAFVVLHCMVYQLRLIVAQNPVFGRVNLQSQQPQQPQQVQTNDPQLHPTAEEQANRRQCQKDMKRLLQPRQAPFSAKRNVVQADGALMQAHTPKRPTTVMVPEGMKDKAQEASTANPNRPPWGRAVTRIPTPILVSDDSDDDTGNDDSTAALNPTGANSIGPSPVKYLDETEDKDDEIQW